jgi:SP family xylose:H+ symportor-like MFS transporter
MLFTLIAIATVDLLGRKPLMVLGYSGMAISLAALGTAAYNGRTEVWVLLFILSYIACFALSVGPVTWVILSEIYPTRIRGFAMSVATILLWAANFVVSWTFPMLDENPYLVDKFNHAAPFWLYGFLCIVAVVFVVMYVPETKGRTLEEIEQHWNPDD